MAQRWWTVVILSMFVVACGGSEPAAPAAPAAEGGMVGSAGAQQSAAGAPAATAPAETAPADPAVSTPRAAAPAASAAVATTDSEIPGVSLAVTQLKRDRGDTVTLRFSITNGTAEPLGTYSHWLGDPNVRTDYRAVGGIHLIDPVNNQKYFVVRDSEHTCVCSREVPDLAPGSSANLWAKFPAPPAGVDAVTIVVPHFIPMDDVPVQN